MKSNLRVTLAAGLMALTACPSSAQADKTTNDLRYCANMKVSSDRLLCFDALAAGIASVAEPETAGVATKESLAPQLPKTFQVVEPLDFYVAPRKFIGKGIELRRSACFYADKDEFRCMTTGDTTVIVFSPAITPQASQSTIEDQCGQVRVAMTSTRCRRSIRFVPLSAELEDLSALKKRVVVITKEIEFAPDAPAKPRR